MFYRVLRDDDRDLVFDGELLAEVRTEQRAGRWFEHRIWRTGENAFVGGTVGRTRWRDERDRYSAVVATGPQSARDAILVAFFGLSDDAKFLFLQAGVDCVERVA